MKNILYTGAVAMLILAAAITYLGLQRENVVNPPVITGIGFFVIAIVFILFGKNIKKS